jgi:hypothetical protein
MRYPAHYGIAARVPENVVLEIARRRGGIAVEGEAI